MLRLNRELTPFDRQRVATEAGCDPRSVAAYLTGRPMRSTTRARVEEALTTLGLTSRQTDEDAAPAEDAAPVGRAGWPS